MNTKDIMECLSHQRKLENITEEIQYHKKKIKDAEESIQKLETWQYEPRTWHENNIIMHGSKLAELKKKFADEYFDD